MRNPFCKVMQCDAVALYTKSYAGHHSHSGLSWGCAQRSRRIAGLRSLRSRSPRRKHGTNIRMRTASRRSHVSLCSHALLYIVLMNLVRVVSVWKERTCRLPLYQL